AVEGGVFDFANGPVLAAGAATSQGTERAAIALGIRLDVAALAAIAGSGDRRVTLTWADDASVPTGVEILAGTPPGRVSPAGPIELGEGARTLIAAVDVPASVLPAKADAGLSRWFGVLVTLVALGVAAFLVIVRTMASGIGDVRTGLLAAQETDGNPAVLDAL